jgi:uncharacterized protein YjeT (DUF2065 family)
MQETLDPTAWTALLLGLYTLFAGIGALRNPGVWRTMIEEVSKSPTLQMMSGLLELVVGAMVYLANPWVPADLLSCAVKAIGGLMMLEALVVAGFCDIYANFWLRNLTHMHRGWAIFSALLGLALTIAAFTRFT